MWKFDEIGPSFISTLWVKIIHNVLIFQTHYPYEGNNFKRFHVLLFLGRITILPSEKTFAPMFERLRTFQQEFMTQFKDTNWQDGFTGFSFQWWQYSIQTIWYVSILIYQGKVFWCKIYVWRSKTLTCLQISISRERLNSFDDSSFIYDFQSFSIDFPSQIWLYIISQKKTRKCSTIVAERVLNVSGKLYTNVLNHTTRKNNILIILS